MIIRDIKLNNFRCHEKLQMSFSPSTNVILGVNGVGKSSILEAINILGIIKSYRSAIDAEMVNKNSESYSIESNVKSGDIANNYKINYYNGVKKITKNGQIIRKMSDYVGEIQMVSFFPNEHEIIVGSPSKRRRFFDALLCQISPNYKGLLIEYRKIIKQRNYLLKSFKKNDQKLIEVYGEKLVFIGSKIQKLRNKLIVEINEMITAKFRKISKQQYNIEIQYIQDTLPIDLEAKMKGSYDKDIKYSTTMTGCHRDDYMFLMDKYEAKTYSSQGQIKAILLSFKLTLLNIIEKITGETPILLLDDVFSELDKEHQNGIIECINGKVQTIITTTSLSDLNFDNLKNTNIIDLRRI